MPSNQYIVNLSTSGGGASDASDKNKPPRLSSNDDIPLLGVHIKVTQTPKDDEPRLYRVLKPFSVNDEGLKFKPEDHYYVYVDVFNDNDKDVKLEYLYWDKLGEDEKADECTIMPNASLRLSLIIIDELDDCGYRLKIDNYSKKLTFRPNIKMSYKSTEIAQFLTYRGFQEETVELIIRTLNIFEVCQLQKVSDVDLREVYDLLTRGYRIKFETAVLWSRSEFNGESRKWSGYEIKIDLQKLKKIISLKVMPSNTIGMVKKMIRDETGIKEEDGQELSYRGRYLDDSYTLQHYNITEVTTLEFDPEKTRQELKNFANYEDKKCCICFEALEKFSKHYFKSDYDVDQEDDVVATQCGHRFHRKCIVPYLPDPPNYRSNPIYSSKPCPICRQPVHRFDLVKQNLWDHNFPLYSCFTFDIHK